MVACAYGSEGLLQTPEAEWIIVKRIGEIDRHGVAPTLTLPPEFAVTTVGTKLIRIVIPIV